MLLLQLKCKNDVTSFNKALVNGMTEHLQSLSQSNASVHDETAIIANGDSFMHSSRHTIQLQRQASLQLVNGKLLQVNSYILPHLYFLT
jgi:hypothetical protein